MRGNVPIASSEGGAFDCYMVTPDSGPAVPALVLASSIFGVDDDLRLIAGEIAALDCIAAAPDLFWRTVPGPLEHGDARGGQRAQPRLQRIKEGEVDLADVLARLRDEPRFNGRAAVMGFCYGGPYAIIGPARLGYDAGIACHGSRMLDFIGDLEGLAQPVRILWGDDDHEAPAPVIHAYRAAATRMNNIAVHVYRGVRHGYTMRSKEAFNRKAFDSSMEHACSLINELRRG